MLEAEHRQLVIDVAASWLGTPYVSNAMIKHRRGGVDCAMILVDVYCTAGIVPKDFDPRPYPPQWHMHRGEEIYLNFVQSFAKEIFTTPKPGDVVLFQIGRLYAHGAIVTDWPKAIHACAPGGAGRVNIAKNCIGKHALANLPQRYFSVWS